MDKTKNVHLASANWAVDNRSPSGVRPPVPNLDFKGQIGYSELPKPVPQKSYNLLNINSQRQPYSVQYLVNGYGGGPTPRLGTNLGT